MREMVRYDILAMKKNNSEMSISEAQENKYISKNASLSRFLW